VADGELWRRRKGIFMLGMRNRGNCGPETVLAERVLSPNRTGMSGFGPECVEIQQIRVGVVKRDLTSGDDLVLLV
jgi:hypothetical protein